MRMKMLQLVVLIALFAICNADVPSRPITVNALAPAAVLPNAALLDSNPANELSEWGEYKVKLSYVMGIFVHFFFNLVFTLLFLFSGTFQKSLW